MSPIVQPILSEEEASELLSEIIGERSQRRLSAEGWHILVEMIRLKSAYTSKTAIVSWLTINRPALATQKRNQSPISYVLSREMTPARWRFIAKVLCVPHSREGGR